MTGRNDAVLRAPAWYNASPTLRAHRRLLMAKQCEICGKKPAVGRKISHAHNVSPRRFEPNLQRVRVRIDGGTRRMRVCTRCIRSNRIVKAA